MDWLTEMSFADLLALIIPVLLIIAVFSFAAIQAHKKHVARLKKIEQDFRPDSHNFPK